MGERVIDDAERRARLAIRHALAPGHRVDTPNDAARAMTALHATEAATVYLSVWARVDGVTVADIDTALYDTRTIVKQLGMRTTLFAVPRELLPAVWASASTRVAGPLRQRLVKDIEAGGLATDGSEWLRTAGEAVEQRLTSGDGMTATAVREEVPEVQGSVTLNPDKPYGGEFAVAPRVLSWLAAEGRIMRGINTGHWRTSRPRWTTTAAWLGEVPPRGSPEDGYAEVVRRWLATFGPGTATDLAWWLGAPAGVVRAALGRVGAVEVDLASGGTGWVLADDVEPVTGPDVPWAALLPVLDPTVMGWKERAFYLGDHATHLFDRNGNAGTTAWWDGRIVGCWVQDPDGQVVVNLLEDVGADARAALDDVAAQLTGWLEGVVVGTVYPSPAMKAAQGR